MSANLCPKCSAPNRDTAKYCAECGEPLLSNLTSSRPNTGNRHSAPTTSVGETLIERYQIESELGRGGFGAVYRALDLRLHKTCAVKENLDVSQEAQRQFAREATVLANLSHPHLPRVTDHFFLPGRGQYLVMDFVDGLDLSSLIDSGQNISTEQAITWISQVLDALEYMHNQSPPILHRDIKPANIRITPQGQAMLVDFGLVKVYDPKLKTTVGARAITPGYAPPEQYGQGSTDVRTDIYAMGATLYALLTRIDPLESVQRMLGERMPLAHEADPKAPKPIGEVIERAMALEPGQRYQSAADFKAALQDALDKSKTADVLVTRVAAQPVESVAHTLQTIAVDPSSQVYAATADSAIPVSEKPRAKSGLSKRWLIAGAGVAGVLFLCLGAIFGLFALFGGDSNEATSTPLALVTTEAPSVIEVTATFDQQRATATRQAQQTAEAQATKNAGAIVTYTARAQATATTRSERTSTAEAQAQATQQAIDAMKAKGEIKYGPRDGIMLHDSDNFLEGSPASPGLRNFIAEVEIFNPYPTSKGPWDYGLIFRGEGGNNQYRLIFTSDKEWYLKLTSGENPNGRLVHQGSISSLNVKEGGSNFIQLIALENDGWLYVNNQFISKLDLSGRYAGSVEVVTGFFTGDEIAGELVKYLGFTVWSIK
jgi:serine/threonine protein kinase